jgi:hypothetical protein
MDNVKPFCFLFSEVKQFHFQNGKAFVLNPLDYFSYNPFLDRVRLNDGQRLFSHGRSCFFRFEI